MFLKVKMKPSPRRAGSEIHFLIYLYLYHLYHTNLRKKTLWMKDWPEIQTTSTIGTKTSSSRAAMPEGPVARVDGWHNPELFLLFCGWISLPITVETKDEHRFSLLKKGQCWGDHLITPTRMGENKSHIPCPSVPTTALNSSCIETIPEAATNQFLLSTGKEQVSLGQDTPSHAVLCEKNIGHNFSLIFASHGFQVKQLPTTSAIEIHSSALG